MSFWVPYSKLKDNYNNNVIAVFQTTMYRLSFYLFKAGIQQNSTNKNIIYNEVHYSHLNNKYINAIYPEQVS